jgi:hypothetical protein
MRRMQHAEPSGAFALKGGALFEPGPDASTIKSIAADKRRQRTAGAAANCLHAPRSYGLWAASSHCPTAPVCAYLAAGCGRSKRVLLFMRKSKKSALSVRSFKVL